MKKFIEWVKNDYRSVSDAWYGLLGNRTPKWVIAVLYAVLIPVGIVLCPVVKIMNSIQYARQTKELKKYFSEERG